MFHRHVWKLVGVSKQTYWCIFDGYTREVYDVYECTKCKKKKYKLKQIQYPDIQFK